MRTRSGERQARAALERQASKAHEQWRKRLWHLSNRSFACEADARAALAHETKSLPAWLKLQSAQVRTEPRYAGRGQPRPDAAPTRHEVSITATCEVDDGQLVHAAERAASFIVATNVLDPAQLADEELIAIYKDQHSVERDFAWLGQSCRLSKHYELLCSSSEALISIAMSRLMLRRLARRLL